MPAPTIEAVRPAAEDQRVRFLWNQGYNVYLAGALTTAALQAHGRHFVYCCASHGLINDPTWLTDLIVPLADESIALAGHVQPCEFNRVASVPADIIESVPSIVSIAGGVIPDPERYKYVHDYRLYRPMPS